jgi:hypothetical protein
LARGRSRIGDRHSAVDVEFPLSAMIEKAAALPDLRNHQPRTNGMDRAGSNEENIVLQDRTPLNQLGDGAVCNRASQFWRRERPL